jgi:hypothetical protein
MQVSFDFPTVHKAIVWWLVQAADSGSLFSGGWERTGETPSWLGGSRGLVEDFADQRPADAMSFGNFAQA